MDTASLLKSTKTSSQVNYAILSSQGRVKLACHSDVRTESPFSSMCPVALSLSLSLSPSLSLSLSLSLSVIMSSLCDLGPPVETILWKQCVFTPCFQCSCGFPYRLTHLCSRSNPHIVYYRCSLGHTRLNNACMTVALDFDVHAGLNDYFFLPCQKYSTISVFNDLIFQEGLHCTHLYNVIMV